MQAVIGGVVFVAVVAGGYFLGDVLIGGDGGKIGAGIAAIAFVALVAKATTGKY